MRQENVASEELTDAFWEMVCELKRGRQGVSYSREDVSGMVNSMLNYRSLELGFIRRVRSPRHVCQWEGGALWFTGMVTSLRLGLALVCAPQLSQIQLGRDNLASCTLFTSASWAEQGPRMGAESCMLLQEVVGQIADCLKSGGEQEGTPSNRWLHDLITAYVSATPTWKPSQRTPLSSPNNDPCCCIPAESNGAPLRRVQPARLQDLPEPAAAGAD